MAKLSVVIMAFNEEKNITDCLESVKDFADEIVVVDNDSIDKTAAIAKKYTKHIYHQKNDPLNLDLQKNFGFAKATKDWILSLDADERVTQELTEEIRESLASSVQRAVNGYWIPRKNIIFGKWIRHTGWYPDYQLRLFRKGKGKYEKQHIHEDLVVEGETSHLKEYLIHMHYERISQFIARAIYIYIPNEIEHTLQKGYTFSYLDIIRFPFQEFLSRFFARRGYKDGLHGLVLSMLMAWYHFMIFLYIWEEKNFIQVDGSDFLEQFEKEVKKMGKQTKYWLLTEKIKASQNISKRYILRVQRKLS